MIQVTHGWGIPQVSYQTESHGRVEWVELYQRMASEGIFVLANRSESESVSHVAASLIYWPSGRGRSVLINGGGGDLYSGSSMADCIRQIPSRVQTVVLGWAASISLVVSSSAQYRYGMHD